MSAAASSRELKSSYIVKGHARSELTGVVEQTTRIRRLALCGEMAAIYHITHFENLASIVDFGSLCCDRINESNKLAKQEIGYQHIKERRKARKVPVGPKGVLADYVPFYFATKSPMLYTINHGNVPGYMGGQAPIVHLVSDTDVVVARGGEFLFTDGHAEMAISEFFADLEDLIHLDWQVMSSRMWNDTVEDGDRMRRRQAEFLVHTMFPWEWVSEIGVINQDMADDVAKVLAKATSVPPINVHRDWYY